MSAVSARVGEVWRIQGFNYLFVVDPDTATVRPVRITDTPGPDQSSHLIGRRSLERFNAAPGFRLAPSLHAHFRTQEETPMPDELFRKLPPAATLPQRHKAQVRDIAAIVENRILAAHEDDKRQVDVSDLTLPLGVVMALSKRGYTVDNGGLYSGGRNTIRW